MHEIAQNIFNITLFTYIAAILFAQGLVVTMAHLIEEFEKVKLIIFTIIANFIVVPLYAYALVSVFDASKGVSIGIILLSLCAGAPFIPKIVDTAKSNTDGAVGLMLLLTVVSIFFMPIAVHMIYSNASISAFEIAKSLIYTMLIPLVFGMIIRAYSPLLAKKIKPWINKLATISLIFLIISFIYLYDHIIYNNLNVIPIIVVFFLGSMAIGYLSAGKNRVARISFSAATGLRNPPIAILVASQYFSSEPIAGVIGMLIIVIGLAISFPLAKFVSK